MNWASRTVSKTLANTRGFLRRQIWVWPIIAVTLLLAIGWGVHGSIERTMESNLKSQLQTLLDVEVAMLRTWLVAHENNAGSVAGDAEVRKLVAQILAARDRPVRTGATPLTSDDLAASNVSGVVPSSSQPTGNALIDPLTKQIAPTMNAHDYDSYLVANRQGVVAANRSAAVGMPIPDEFVTRVEQVFNGETVVVPPFPSVLPLADETGKAKTGVPVMYVLAPIVDDDLQVIAVLGFQIRPEREFTRILQLGRLGESGETYAFDSTGRMLSNSRFDHDLILMGLLPDQENSRSILQLLVRDPGGNLTNGFRPQIRRSELPPTRMVEAAVDGRPGVDVAGYRDYRGVPVVGAWTWLPEYKFGVTTEVDYSEAFRPLTILKRTFWGLLGLLGISSIAIFVFMIIVSRLQRQAREATIEARQLGQYQLEEKLGEGGMGVVYRGRHAMLRRPTAVKLLDTSNVSETSIARFEREVQITSNLNHPNTIAIYDYGHTPEGVFYYAMEFLDGIDLQRLVEQYGPQPPGRVIYLLKQICGSLYEAHSSGVVHRDIKPANTMINRRGGEGDVIKVLDFGLVKARDDGDRNDDQGMAGTPLYMSPEAIQVPGSVDACSDLYAVGGVGYFLLTGRPLFEADDLMELCRLQTSEVPVPPSERLGQPVPSDLEHAIMSCLEKNRAKRPQTARDLARLLSRCKTAQDWSVDEADEWWGRHERGEMQQTASVPAKLAKVDRTKTASNQYDVTVAPD